jgi:hypothetical protein
METLITPLACTQQAIPDYRVGTEVASVTVTVAETCIGSVYDTQAFTTLTAQYATQDATAKLGAGYTPTDLQSSIVQATPTTHGTVALRVTSSSTWAYQYNPEQVQRLKVLLAGMNRDSAKATVLHLVGMQSTSISITNNGTTLPTDTARIHVLFVQMS